MTKEQLGKQIETLRKECGVSTYELEQKGIHPSLPSTIEKGKKGYTIDSLIKYLNAIGEGIVLSVGRKEKQLTTHSVSHCTCPPDETTGATSVKCCNIVASLPKVF